ncbi:MAG TPA: glycosyltransferase family 4 protein [Candidatus Paceibacterota bacterium]|nr:glycosyltransferase family 4 protein [Candidatus Paceibacterota bacterium]
MSVSIITFANLGEQKNLKTADIEPVIDIFAEHKELAQVVCLLHRNFYFNPTVSAIPAWMWYPLRAYERVFDTAIARYKLEAIFDYFAASKLARADAVLFHGGYFLSRTLQKAHTNKSIAIDLTVTAHIHSNAEMEKAELQSLGIKHEGIFTKFDKRSPHLGAFDYLIAISDFVKRTYVEQGYPADRIFVAHPDIDITRFAPAHASTQDDIFRVVYAAYTTPLKGLHYLLDAWSALRLPHAELVLVGGYGDMPEELKHRYDAMIAKDSSITWVGNSHTPEKYFKDASVCVFPSLTEGFGRVTLEAMACGLPVITTENAAGIVEDGKTGFVVPIRSAQALAEKIRYLYEHRDEVARMGKAARAAVEHKKPFGEAVWEIYQEILRREKKI